MANLEKMALNKEILALQSSYDEGEVIFSENDLSRDLYVLLKGRVDVVQRGVSLAVLDKPGSFLGEMALLSGQPRSATLIAREKVVMLKVSPENISLLLRHMPDLMMKIAKNLAGTVSNLNKELLKAREAMSLVDLIQAELESKPQGTIEEVIPRMFKEVQQHQHENMMEVAQCYLKSHVFIDPFIASVERTLKPFFNHAIKVDRDDPNNLAVSEKICGTDFTGAMSGSFLFMAQPEALTAIGKQLFGARNDEEIEKDTIMELARKIIEAVKQAVPGLHLEISRPEMLEQFTPTNEFMGLKLKTDIGFQSWVYLNN